MHLTASTAVAVLSLIVSSSAADTTTAQSATNTGDIISIDFGSAAPPGALATPDRSSLISNFLVKASSQVSNDPAVKSQLSTISGVSGVDAPKDIASVVAAWIYSGTQPYATPSWINAAGTTGAVHSLVWADIAGFANSALAAITPVSTSGVTSSTSMSSSMRMSTSMSSSMITSSASKNSTSTSGSSSSTSGGSSSASSGSSTAPSGSPTSAKSTGGAASQPTGAIVAAGAAAAGILGLAALL